VIRMAQIPVLLTAAKTPRPGEKVLTPSETVATITKVAGGFVYSDPLTGPESALPVSSLRWFSQLDIWVTSKEPE
jgi:hypothetical protein